MKICMKAKAYKVTNRIKRSGETNVLDPYDMGMEPLSKYL